MQQMEQAAVETHILGSTGNWTGDPSHQSQKTLTTVLNHCSSIFSYVFLSFKIHNFPPKLSNFPGRSFLISTLFPTMLTMCLVYLRPVLQHGCYFNSIVNPFCLIECIGSILVTMRVSVIHSVKIVRMLKFKYLYKDQLWIPTDLVCGHLFTTQLSIVYNFWMAFFWIVIWCALKKHWSWQVTQNACAPTAA